MSPASNRFFALCALAALSLSSGASLAAEAKPETDRAYCLSGRSGQDVKACLREAGAARAEATRGRLAAGEGDFERNKLARCAAHKDPAEKELCERRARGEGTVSGSVEGGGLIRELVVPVPAGR